MSQKVGQVKLGSEIPTLCYLQLLLSTVTEIPSTCINDLCGLVLDISPGRNWKDQTLINFF